jgi:hypothetical protein
MLAKKPSCCHGSPQTNEWQALALMTAQIVAVTGRHSLSRSAAEKASGPGHRLPRPALTDGGLPAGLSRKADANDTTSRTRSRLQVPPAPAFSAPVSARVAHVLSRCVSCGLSAPQSRTTRPRLITEARADLGRNASRAHLLAEGSLAAAGVPPSKMLTLQATRKFRCSTVAPAFAKSRRSDTGRGPWNPDSVGPVELWELVAIRRAPLASEPLQRFARPSCNVIRLALEPTLYRTALGCGRNALSYYREGRLRPRRLAKGTLQAGTSL